MRFTAREPGMILSTAAHAALVVWGMVALSSPKPFDEFAEAVPVDVISDASFREMTKGVATEKEVRPDTPQRVDRVAKVEEQKDPGADKRDVPTPPPPPLRPAVKEASEDRDAPPPPPKVARIEPPKPEPSRPPPPAPPKPDRKSVV